MDKKLEEEFDEKFGHLYAYKEIDSTDSRKYKRKSKGFCGYGWMVDSIIQHGKILNSSQRKKLVECVEIV